MGIIYIAGPFLTGRYPLSTNNCLAGEDTSETDG